MCCGHGSGRHPVCMRVDTMSIEGTMNTTFPGPTKNTKLKVDIKKIVLLKDPAQTELLLGRLAKRIEAHPEDTAWSELMKEDVREYVFKHLSAPATDVLRVLVGSKSKGKQQLADELAEAEALPVPVSFLKDWASRAVLVSSGGEDPGRTRIPRVGDREEEGLVPEAEERARQQEEAKKAMDQAQAAFTPASMAMMQMMVQSMVSAMPAAQVAPTPTKEKEEDLTPVEKVAKAVKRAVSKRKALDFCILGDAHKKRLEEKSTGFTVRSSVQLIGGYLREEDGTEVPENDAYNPTEVRQGSIRWIAECSRSDAYDSEEVADLLEWHARVYALKVPTEVSSEQMRAKYVKAFAVKHQGKRDWVDLHESDFMLARKYLGPRGVSASDWGSNGGGGYGGGGNGGGGRGGGGRGGGGKGTVGRGGGGKSNGRGENGESKWFCKPYYQVDFAGECDFRDCKREHMCANCGGGHTAAKCKVSWNTKKVEEAVKGRGQRYFATAFQK